MNCKCGYEMEWLVTDDWGNTNAWCPRCGMLYSEWIDECDRNLRKEWRSPNNKLEIDNEKEL